MRSVLCRWCNNDGCMAEVYEKDGEYYIVINLVVTKITKEEAYNYLQKNIYNVLKEVKK